MGPLRLADTRELGTRVLAGGALVMPLPGLSPDTSAVVVNVTITSTDGAGFATAFSNGDSVPPTATVTSDGPGQTRSATAIVPVSATGLKVFASVGTHIVVDLFGSFTGPSAAQGTAGLFTAIDPQRYLDTRSVSPLGVGVPLYPQGGLEMALPTNAAVPVFMIAAVDAAPGFLTTFPAGTARPGTASATIARPSETVANLAFAQKSTRGLSIFSYGTSHVVVDLVGWFSGVTRAATLGPPTNIAPPPPPAPTPAAPTPAPAPAPAPVTPPVAVPEPIEYLPLGSSGCNASIRVAVAKADAQTIGFSVEGRPIIAEHYGDPAGKPVLVVGPIHGDECSALAVVERVRALGRDGAVPPGLHLVVIPALNPDGLISGSRRNANGVDLNKDGGDWSQPETRALMDLTSTLQPRATIHLHSPLSMVGGQGGPFGLGTFMADHIAQRTGMHHSHSAGSSAPFLWLGQASILPSMAAVLVETPRGFPFEAMGATGEVKPGPPGSDALWQTTAEAIIESFSLV